MRNDRSWMYLPRRLPEFENGVTEFLNASFSKAVHGNQIRCPCKRCKNRYWLKRHEVFDHLIGFGFVENYVVWIFHGEDELSNETINEPPHENHNFHDNTDTLLEHRFRNPYEGSTNVQNGPNDEAKKFYRMLEEGEQELYPGCKNFSKLSFIIRLFLYKSLHGISNTSFNDLLRLLRDMVPEAKIPGNFNEARKIVRDLGLDYNKILACRNDRMLFGKSLKIFQECHKCHASKWKESKESCNGSSNSRKIPAKDGFLRHPADGAAWKSFDSLYPWFADEPRNIRLGLASDGFNPLRTMSIAHSTWPVVLVNYNLPPWMFMKPEFFMLSLLIPGPEGPGNNIDVYLQPLIEELKDLWNVGLQTYDKFRNETFRLHATLNWTISDFLDSLYLKHSKKICYMGSRRFLDVNDPSRRNKKSFNGKQKIKRNSDSPWKKKSIFFYLPYWRHIKCRHNLDVMHIEKNVCDNVLGTLLDIPGKSKDHTNARFDLLELGIKEDLHPQLSKDKRRVSLQKACYTMSSTEKYIFCRALKSAKLLYGLASNISRCVNLAQKKVSGYKSHDAHILLEYLLQVAVRKSLPRHVAIPLIRLGNYFRKLYSKVVNPGELDALENEIIQILCELEKIFLPCFFDIMVHLPIHLVEEIRLGGLVHGRGMYFIERYLCKLKSYVRNRGRPEGSIAEGYLIEECMNFCSRYVDGGKTRCSKDTDDEIASDGTKNRGNVVFSNIGHPLGGKRQRSGKVFTLDTLLGEQAHRYALLNSDSDEVNEYIKEHEVFVNSQRHKSKWKRARSYSHEFANWLKEKAKDDGVSEQIFWLAKGPSPTAKRYKGYYANGYEYYAKSRDARCTTQNSGVSLSALTSSFASSKDKNPIDGEVTYYGAVLEIIELSYWSQFMVVLFRCEWYHVEKDEYGLTCVNVNKFCSVDDPFVMPSQVHQVFYVADPVVDGLHYVMAKVPRDVFDYDDTTEEAVSREPDDPVLQFGPGHLEDNVTLSREGLEPTVLDANTLMASSNTLVGLNDDNSDCDDTLWEWMQADDEECNNAE
ncbi:uncharacterized protein LOC141590217 [Silene latifolia]|uniref:uncharacterized protein LOC141590217 n=1 Tax=Silene latifolia TaxID=37657 RepID=UPI003D77ED34